MDIGLIDSDKVALMIDQLGLEGYGAMMLLNEKLATTPTHKLHISFLPVLARKYNTSTVKLETVVKSYGLFVLQDEHIFYSQEINEKIVVYAKGMKQKIEAGKSSAKKRQEQKALNGGIAQRSFNGRSTVVTTDAQQYNKIKDISFKKDIYLLTEISHFEDGFIDFRIGDFLIQKIFREDDFIKVDISLIENPTQIFQTVQIKNIESLKYFLTLFYETKEIPQGKVNTS
jgi:hypothetical protein